MALLAVAQPVCAISKVEFMKMTYEGRQKFAIVSGMSNDYAVPREEYLKLPFEIREVMGLEFDKEQVDYRIQNIGKKLGDLDVSYLYRLSMINGDDYLKRDKDLIISYRSVCGSLLRYGNHFRAAEYCWKDYLEWKKQESGQPALYQHSGGDYNDQPSRTMCLYTDYDMYKELDIIYADYNDFWWKRYAAAECRLRTDAGPDCIEKWLEQAEDYQAFLEQWTEIKQKAKTVKPKPLPLPVQMHEDFYSADVKKVLGALEYYRMHKVRFMVEKALKDKRPAVARKAQEHLDNWDKPAPGVVISTASESSAK